VRPALNSDSDSEAGTRRQKCLGVLTCCAIVACPSVATCVMNPSGCTWPPMLQPVPVPVPAIANQTSNES
jgi:hypothetical protein